VPKKQTKQKKLSKKAAPKPVKKLSKPASLEEKKSIETDSGKKKVSPELLRGFRDILPDEQPYWDFVRDRIRSIAEVYSFKRIDMPILEEASLFLRTLGKQTDVVEKEMYVFEAPSGEKVALRPEATSQALVYRFYVSPRQAASWKIQAVPPSGL